MKQNNIMNHMIQILNLKNKMLDIVKYNLEFNTQYNIKNSDEITIKNNTKNILLILTALLNILFINTTTTAEADLAQSVQILSEKCENQDESSRGVIRKDMPMEKFNINASGIMELNTE